MCSKSRVPRLRYRCSPGDFAAITLTVQSSRVPVPPSPRRSPRPGRGSGRRWGGRCAEARGAAGRRLCCSGQRLAGGRGRSRVQGLSLPLLRVPRPGGLRSHGSRAGGPAARLCPPHPDHGQEHTSWVKAETGPLPRLAALKGCLGAGTIAERGLRRAVGQPDCRGAAGTLGGRAALCPTAAGGPGGGGAPDASSVCVTLVRL